MCRLDREECVGDAEVMVIAKFEKSLSIFSYLPNTKVSYTLKPGVMIGAYLSIKVIRKVKMFRALNDFNGVVGLLIEPVF